MSLHLELGSAIEAAFEEDLDAPVEQKQDALIIRLKNGVTLDVRYAAPDAYSLRWTYGDAESGIDTAPLHRGLATFPNHLHDAGGRIMADPVTHPEATPEDNLQKLIRVLLDDRLQCIRQGLSRRHARRDIADDADMTREPAIIADHRGNGEFIAERRPVLAIVDDVAAVLPATVEPIASEEGLRQRAWVEDNRRRVDDLSDGKLAYVWVPNTGTPGVISFNRYFFAQQDRLGAVIDERFNGGGLLDDYMVDLMTRRLRAAITNEVPGGKPFRLPAGILGPKVLLINELAGSGGDFFPWVSSLPPTLREPTTARSRRRLLSSSRRSHPSTPPCAGRRGGTAACLH